MKLYSFIIDDNLAWRLRRFPQELPLLKLPLLRAPPTISWAAITQYPLDWCLIVDTRSPS